MKLLIYQWNSSIIETNYFSYNTININNKNLGIYSTTKENIAKSYEKGGGGGAFVVEVNNKLQDEILAKTETKQSEDLKLSIEEWTFAFRNQLFGLSETSQKATKRVAKNKVLL